MSPRQAKDSLLTKKGKRKTCRYRCFNFYHLYESRLLPFLLLNAILYLLVAAHIGLAIAYTTSLPLMMMFLYPVAAFPLVFWVLASDLKVSL